MPKKLADLRPCPCCGEKTVGEEGAYEICPICNWEDDPVQSANPSYAGGANDKSLIHARRTAQSTLAP